MIIVGLLHLENLSQMINEIKNGKTYDEIQSNYNNKKYCNN